MGTRLTAEVNGMAALRCDECGRPFAILKDNVLIIKSRHGGKEHTNVVTLAELMKMMSGSAVAA